VFLRVETELDDPLEELARFVAGKVARTSSLAKSRQIYLSFRALVRAAYR
jgi:hypothetical protein